MSESCADSNNQIPEKARFCKKCCDYLPIAEFPANANVCKKHDYLGTQTERWCHANTGNGKSDLGEIPESFVDFTGIEPYLPDSMETYEDMKQDFELTNAKILHPAMIVFLNKKEKYVRLTMNMCKDSYGHLQCKTKIKGKWEIKQFINIWLKDKNIRVFDKLVFEPPPLVCNKCNFNMWTPFKIAKEPLIVTERDYWKEYCQYLKNLLGDEKIVKYVLARYAFRLINPAVRTHVVLIISGIEGDGKNRMLAPLYNIMEGYTCELSSAKRLYDTHSMFESQKLFIMVSEAVGVANFENSEILKTRATEPTLYVNPKGVQAFKLDNLCDYDMTTNNQNVVKLTDDSRRRFLQIKTTSYYLNNVEFFNDYIVNIENNPIALRQIYNGMINFDYKAVVPSLNFQDNRYKPTTNIEAHVRQQTRNKIIWFLEDWVKVNLDCKRNDNEKYTNDALFKMYIKWCDESRVKMDYNKISFGMKFSVLMKKQLNTGGFSCVKKDNSHSTTTLCFSEFVRYFKNLNGFELKQSIVDEDTETNSTMKRKAPHSIHSCNSAFAGEISVRDLKTTILTYVQTPKKVAKVMGCLKSQLQAPFEKNTEINLEEQETGTNSKIYKHKRIRSVVSSGLHRAGCVKNGKTLKYLGANSYDMVIDHIQKKIDYYNAQHVGKKQMSFENIELDHIKPVQRFALEMSHYKNLQPLFKKANLSKSAKWTDIDETFWRANIQHQHDFTDIYMGTELDPSENSVQ